ncbi:MAG: hypothetical protein OXT65_07495 [Alphaproteobacteria bacterium]|nr:hypothetical protein [Alphaproteobacteria bacterium]
MYLPALKIIVAASIIAFASWLSGKKPELAGFIVALPLTSMLALAFAYGEYKNPEASVTFAKSIFAAIPVSLLFFVPFLLADKIPTGFWGLFGIGLALVACGYFAHGWILKAFLA